MDNFNDSNAEQNRVASVPEALSEEIRLLLEYLIEAKKKLSSFLLGEVAETQAPVLDGSKVLMEDRRPDIPETKSISTGDSMENVFMNFSGMENQMFSQTTFKCEQSHTFCKNVYLSN